MVVSCHVGVLEWIHTLNKLGCQRTPYSKEAQYLKSKWQQRDSNPQPLSLKTNTQPFSQTGQLYTYLVITRYL